MKGSDSVAGRVDAALRKCDQLVDRVSISRWTLTLLNGRPLDVDVAVDEHREWVTLDAAVDEVSGPGSHDVLWRSLALNASMRGFAKLALARDGLRLRAEIPAHRADVLADRIVGTCGHFKDARAALEAELEGEKVTSDATTARDGSQVDADEAAALCRAAGWRVSPRAEGFMVDLDCAPRFYRAFVQPQGRNGLLMRAELHRFEQLGERPRAAVAAALLTTASSVRLARAAVDEGAQSSAQLQVSFEHVPDATDLDHALSALSAGCRAIGDETKVLAHEHIAAKYLARWPSGKRPWAETNEGENDVCFTYEGTRAGSL